MIVQGDGAAADLYAVAQNHGDLINLGDDDCRRPVRGLLRGPAPRDVERQRLNRSFARRERRDDPGRNRTHMSRRVARDHDRHAEVGRAVEQSGELQRQVHAAMAFRKVRRKSPSSNLA
ncbi:hypothetical protein D3C72_2174480 [compost metagenome]